MSELFAIEEGQLRALKLVATRLFTEQRLNGDEMRDLAQLLEAIERACRQIPIPTNGGE